MVCNKINPEHWIHNIDQNEDFLITITNYERYNPRKEDGGWFKMMCSLPFSKMIYKISPHDSFTPWLYVCLLCACPQACGKLTVSKRFLGKLHSRMKVSLPSSLLKLVEIKAIFLEKAIDRIEEIDRKEAFSLSPKTSNPSGCDSATPNQNNTLPPWTSEQELISLIRKFYGDRKLSDEFIKKEMNTICEFVCHSESNFKDFKYAVGKISRMCEENKKRKQYGFFATKLETLLDFNKDMTKYLDNDYEPFLLNKEDYDSSVIDCNTDDPEEDARTLKKLIDMGYEVM